MRVTVPTASAHVLYVNIKYSKVFLFYFEFYYIIFYHFIDKIADLMHVKVTKKKLEKK